MSEEILFRICLNCSSSPPSMFVCEASVALFMGLNGQAVLVVTS